MRVLENRFLCLGGREDDSAAAFSGEADLWRLGLGDRPGIPKARVPAALAIPLEEEF